MGAVPPILQIPLQRIFTLKWTKRVGPLSEIVDHMCNNSETDQSQHTTKGWKFLVAWKDGSTSYVPLREMKNSYPLETVDYAVGNGIDK